MLARRAFLLYTGTMDSLTDTLPHTAAQPGLRGHSHDPEFDLMKRFIIWKLYPGKGKSGVKSFHTEDEVHAWLDAQDNPAEYEYEDRAGAWGNLTQ